MCGTRKIPPFAWMLAAVAGVLACTVEQAQALPRLERYVEVSVNPEELDLGSVLQPGTYDSPTELTVHVAANCNHGGVTLSATSLKRTGGGEIPLERFFVKLPTTGVFVPMTAPILLTGPMVPGVFDVMLKFRLKTLMQDPAGKYTGTITLTVGP